MGGPRGRVMKSSDFISDHSGTAVSGVCLGSTRGTCQMNAVLLACVSCAFLRILPCSPYILISPSRMD